MTFPEPNSQTGVAVYITVPRTETSHRITQKGLFPFYFHIELIFNCQRFPEVRHKFFDFYEKLFKRKSGTDFLSKFNKCHSE